MVGIQVGSEKEGASVGDELGDMVGPPVGPLVGLSVGGTVKGLPVGAALSVEGWIVGIGVQYPQSKGQIILARLCPSVEHCLNSMVSQREISSCNKQSVGLTVGCGVGIRVGGRMVGTPVGHKLHDSGQ